MNMEYKRRTFQTNIICYMLIISIIAGLFAYFTPKTTYAYEQKSGIVKVDDVLNVRTGPGTSYGKLTSNGSNVRLANGTALTIIGEEYATDGSKWYQVKFTYNGSTCTGYVHSNYVYLEETIDNTQDGDFEAYLTKQGFPEDYKVLLRKLHQKYPNWVFVADQLDYDWNTVVENEFLTGRSLIAKSSISSWKSTETDAYNWSTGEWYGFDGGSWAAASKELVAYALDPRNFLDEKYIFQFELLSYQSSYQTLSGLKGILSGTFMENGMISDDNGGTMTYADALMAAALSSGVSPYSLASAIIQEQGSNGTGKSISGTVSGYQGYYNYFNWGAYASGGNSAVVNGLIYAKQTDTASLRPWNRRYKSIVGGAALYGKSYINIGQDTIYYKKFDFVGTPYTHQYMTHIIAARNEGLTASNGYSDSMKASETIVFKIPVFKNMPSTVCALPTKDGSPNNVLSSLKVSAGNMTQTFDKFTQTYDVTVENSVSSITVTAAAVDSKAVVSGTGAYSLNVGSNEISVKVTAQNGDVRTYKIYVNRKAATGTTGTTTTPAATAFSYSVKIVSANESSKIITGVTEGTTVDTLKSYITVTGGSVSITDSNGKTKTGTLGTGDSVRLLDSKGSVQKTFSIVIYGDVNGDGAVTIKDAYLVRKHILGESKLTGIYATAGDVNRGNDGITIKDAYLIKRHILGEAKISQS
jgi:beta-N-acetylglucosaminidase/uncharacterized protein YraI